MCLLNCFEREILHTKILRDSRVLEKKKTLPRLLTYQPHIKSKKKSLFYSMSNITLFKGIWSVCLSNTSTQANNSKFTSEIH